MSGNTVQSQTSEVQRKHMSDAKRYTVEISTSSGQTGDIKDVSAEQLPDLLVQAKKSGLFPSFEEQTQQPEIPASEPADKDDPTTAG